MVKRIVLLSFFLFSCTGLMGKPYIVFSKLEHDFGVIKQEQIVKTIISFENKGDAVLIIKNVEASCGCTGTKVDKMKLAPGEKGNLEVNFNSGHYNGRVSRSIVIHTNDPANPTIMLKIFANVVPK